MDVTFVRHGQTDANLERRFQPPSEPLNARGVEQAMMTARLLAGQSFEGLLCGTATRTLQTSQHILKAVRAGRVGCTRALDEIDAGILTGLTFEEAHRLHPALSMEYFGTWPDFSYPDSSRFARFYERCQAFIEWLRRCCQPGPWLLVGSEGAILAMACAAAGRAPERMFDQKIGNGGMLRLAL